MRGVGSRAAKKRCVSASWSRQPPASTGAMCRCLANKKGRSLPGERHESGESRFTNVTEVGSRSTVAPGVARCYLPLVWDRHPHPMASMASEASGRLHTLEVGQIEVGQIEVGQIEVADRPQRVCIRARVQGLRQRSQPCPVLVLQGEKLGHGVAPFLCAATSVGGPPVSEPWRPVRVLCPKARLPLGRRHRFLA